MSVMQNLQFVQEFNSHTNYLRNFAMKLTRDKNAADDLFQETALRAFRHQTQYINNTNLKAWLSTIMKNSFINLQHRNLKSSRLSFPLSLLISLLVLFMISIESILSLLFSALFETLH